MKKTVYFLLICFTGILFSCSEDEVSTDSSIQSKKNISFAELQKKLTVSSKISVPNKMGKGIEDFEIDTTHIVQITTETVTTYSMKVTPVTGDDGFSYSYYIYDGGGNVSRQIVRFDYSQGVNYTADNISIVYDSNDSGTMTGRPIGCTTIMLVVAPCVYGNWHDDDACEADGWVVATITICDGGGGIGGEHNGPVVPPNNGLPGEGEQPGGGSGDNYSDFDYFLMDLSPEASDWLTDSENVWILNEILNYLEVNNYYDNGAYDFALWAVEYLMENSEVTWAQFEKEFITFPPPTIPIINIQIFLSCFDIHQPANLTVYAQKMFNGNGVGHAFISITQGNNTRTFGFYPKLEFPSNTNGPGIFGNDSGHTYTYGWNIGAITSLQLQQIIGDTIAFSNSDYNVLMNNCSDFANYVLQITGTNCNASGIDTPDTIINLISNNAQYTNGTAP